MSASLHNLLRMGPPAHLRSRRLGWSSLRPLPPHSAKCSKIGMTDWRWTTLVAGFITLLTQLLFVVIAALISHSLNPPINALTSSRPSFSSFIQQTLHFNRFFSDFGRPLSNSSKDSLNTHTLLIINPTSIPLLLEVFSFDTEIS